MKKELPAMSVCMECRTPARMNVNGRSSVTVYCPNDGCRSIPAWGSNRPRAIREWNKIQSRYHSTEVQR